MDQRERMPDMETAMLTAVDGFMKEVWCALPGLVQSFDPSDMTCTVQPMIKQMQNGSGPNGLTPKGSAVPSAPTQNSVSWRDMTPLEKVPIVFMGGGGLWLTFSPQAGDECLLVVASRCIDYWWDQGPDSNGGGPDSGGIPQAQAGRDSFAIVGPRSRPNALQNISPNAQLRTTDGTAYLELTPDGVLNIVAPGGVNITADVNIDGDIVTSKEGTIDGIVISTHTHSGVQSGESDTGPPNS